MSSQRSVVGRWLKRMTGNLFNPVHPGSIVFFRIAFGLAMVWQSFVYYAEGRIRRYFLEPSYFFSYPGLSWVEPWAGQGMYWHFAVIAISGLFVSLGLFYRLSTTILFCSFTYMFLIDRVNYLNHFYLMSLVSFLLIFIPAHRQWSLDSLWNEYSTEGWMPAWSVWILRFQLGLVYFYGGIAKLNRDWLRGQPGGVWFADKNPDIPLITDWFTQPTLVLGVSYGGLFLDLLAVPLLLWRKSRPWMFLILVLFHLANAQFLYIGIFPWLAIAATTIFLAPDWPVNLLPWGKSESPPETTSLEGTSYWRTALVGCLSIYVVIQLLVPLRGFLFDTQPSWTSWGHRFSWRMKLHRIRTRTTFLARYDGSNGWDRIRPTSHLTLNNKQRSRMNRYPDMTRQLAKKLSRVIERKKNARHVEIRVWSHGNFNGRGWKDRIKRTVDLTKTDITWFPPHWIHPLRTSLPRKRNQWVQLHRKGILK